MVACWTFFTTSYIFTCKSEPDKSKQIHHVFLRCLEWSSKIILTTKSYSWQPCETRSCIRDGKVMLTKHLTWMGLFWWNIEFGGMPSGEQYADIKETIISAIIGARQSIALLLIVKKLNCHRSYFKYRINGFRKFLLQYIQKLSVACYCKCEFIIFVGIVSFCVTN